MNIAPILVKNMVCHRCVMAVEQILQNTVVDYETVLVGEIHLKQAISETKKQELAQKLSAIGLELIDNRATGIIEKIKQLVIKKARNEVDEMEKKVKLSTYLSRNLFHEYSYLSSLFSNVEGRTIENYFIQQRIEKAKELLVYGEMTLSAIALEMEYSSTAHLSSQFKQVTGLTPSHFKKVSTMKRKLLDHI